MAGILKTFAVASGAILIASTATVAAPVILASAVSTITLNAVGGSGYPMGVAYDPNFNQYYGGGGGFPSASIWVWDGSGAVIQSLTPGNVDVRGMTYNANTGNIETIGYGTQSGYDPGSGYAGLRTMGRDGAGLFTGTNTTQLTIMPGLASDQTVPAYDPDSDNFLSRSGSNVVNIVRHSDGSLVSQVALDHGAAGAGFVQNETIGFDSFFDVFVELDITTSRALVYDMTGSFLGASLLPNLGFDSYYSLGYTNGQLFVGSNQGDGSYFGFQIFNGSSGSVPSPGALALFGLGLFGLGMMRRKAAA